MLYIGIDVGGTNLKAGLVDETVKILAVERCPLNFQGPEQFAEDVARLAASAAGKGGVAPESLAYVGMGLPGAVSGGDILFTTNIPMKDVPIERLFRRHLDLPLLLGNDADCAAVGEFFCGAGRGTRDFAVVTLGTGIGCGLLLGGKLHGGPASSEAGHLVICHGGELCNCGRRGCWERYASATALIQQTKAAMAAHPESLLHAIAAENGGVVEGRTAFQAARAGDETALAVCRQYVEYLADGTISLCGRSWPGSPSPATAVSPPASCGRSWATTPASSARRCLAAQSEFGRSFHGLDSAIGQMDGSVSAGLRHTS